MNFHSEMVIQYFPSKIWVLTFSKTVFANWIALAGFSYAPLDVWQLQKVHHTEYIIISIDWSAQWKVFLKSFCSEMNCSCVTGFSSSAGELQLHCLHNWIGIRQRRLSAGKIKRIVSVTNVWLERRFSWLASDWHLWPHKASFMLLYKYVWQL